MSRAAGIDDEEIFRVVESYPGYRDGKETDEAENLVYGPYSTLSAARAMRTRERRNPMSPQSTFTIERSPVVWEGVE